MGFLRFKLTDYNWVQTYPAGGEWRLLFGRSKEGALISEQRLVSQEWLTTIVPKLVNAQRLYESDCALLLCRPGALRSLFFQGDSYQWFDWEQGRTSEGPWAGLGNWGSTLPAGWHSQIEALFPAPDAVDGARQTYFFKGGRVLATGDDQGTLLAFLAPTPPPHHRQRRTPRDQRTPGDHPLAAYARLARGANAGRHFQTVGDGRLQIRQPDITTSVTQLTEAINTSRSDQNTGLDNLTLDAALRRLATVHAEAGDLERADAALDTLVTHFHDQGDLAHVEQHIQQQADETRAQIHEAAGE
ncbi:hypothetical protein ACFQ61_07310 [Streptomyces sp. NPDC056500]|uniref:hypothetical protein n=1 Tax=Streptomyces sp. NPDC056500 TaxID=3345840 RepID=UPI0036C3CA92